MRLTVSRKTVKKNVAVRRSKIEKILTVSRKKKLTVKTFK